MSADSKPDPLIQTMRDIANEHAQSTLANIEAERRLREASQNVTATALEAATILKLRDRAGWWCGDKRAVMVLREFAGKIADEIRDMNRAIERERDERDLDASREMDDST